MVKKSKGVKTSSNSTDTSPTVIFPRLSPKQDLTCREVLQDQILLIDGILSAEECKTLVRFVDGLPLELTPPPKRGEAERVNHRFSVISTEFAKQLHDIFSPHLPSFPSPPSVKAAPTASPRLPHSFNANIRLYKYTQAQYFGPHYDDSVRDSLTGARSEWTVLIYLTGVEDGVEGGETLFYKEERGKPRQVITPPLSRGTALLHRHGNECMLHEGSPVRKGTKYVLRSDLMFMK